MGKSNINQFKHAFSITPDDDEDITVAPASLYVGVAGDVKVDMEDGTTVTFKNVPVGFMPIKVNRVYATGTDASEIIGGN